MMYSNILVAVDGSDASGSGLEEAIRIAVNQKSKLRLLHVVHSPMPDYGYQSGDSREEVIAALCRNGQEVLHQAEILARRAGLAPECVLCESIPGLAAGVILDHARQWPADLIVLGTHARHDLARVGVDSMKVLEAALVPVLSVRAKSSIVVEAADRVVDCEAVAS